MTLLPIDWLEKKAYSLNEVVGASYANLLKLVHNITILNEGLVGFKQAKLSLEEKLKVSEGPRPAQKLWGKQERVRALEGLVAIEHGLAEVLRQKVAELEETLELEEAIVKATKDRRELIKAKEDKAKAIVEAKLKGIKEFKALVEFENDVVEGSSVAYMYDFEAYKRCLDRRIPKLNLSDLHPNDSNDEGGARSSD
ncbi:hypothetical protein COCNU_15G001880 [Cocos nucifera]|uniref:Uncharacterized protein n=1 Tax=Cocos nucifera TaxID=13894 RepID=A0A8K0IWR5_COCNU|nr:hypothetical protein COCNU_15G001880 [Cocos nucifera]